jgi:hypothetical protein
MDPHNSNGCPRRHDVGPAVWEVQAVILGISILIRQFEGHGDVGRAGRTVTRNVWAVRLSAPWLHRLSAAACHDNGRVRECIHRRSEIQERRPRLNAHCLIASACFSTNIY